MSDDQQQRQHLKVWATSDIHGNLNGLEPKLAGADIAVIAGDIAPCHGHSRRDMIHQVKWMNTEFSEWIASNPSVTFVFTPGNHDLFAQSDLRNNVKLPPNATMLIDRHITFRRKDWPRPIQFYGSPWVPYINGHWAFECNAFGDDVGISQRYSRIAHGVDILISHTPPFIEGSTIDTSEGRFDIMTGQPMHFGSEALSRAVRSCRPKYLVCGHIHTGDHEPVRFRDTICLNVSRVNEAYEISYDPTVFEI